jgi:hypothetical protein
MESPLRSAPSLDEGGRKIRRKLRMSVSRKRRLCINALRAAGPSSVMLAHGRIDAELLRTPHRREPRVDYKIPFLFLA